MKSIATRLHKAIAAIGLAALSLGAIAIPSAHAQQSATPNDFAIVVPVADVMKQDEFGIAIPFDYGIVIPVSTDPLLNEFGIAIPFDFGATFSFDYGVICPLEFGVAIPLDSDPARAIQSISNPDEFGVAIPLSFRTPMPLDYGLVVPLSSGRYETTSHTRSGYACTIASKTAFSKQPQGNYLFIMDPDGNYLFTNSGGGLLMTPGGYGMTLNGNVQTPKGDLVPVGNGYTTPAGYTYGLNKDGSRSLTLPNGSVFVIQDSVGPHMDPSGVYYD